MESDAKGCEVVISGKLRAARAKSMKFTDGFMIHSGQPARDFVDEAVRHVMLRQGVLGIKVKMYVFASPIKFLTHTLVSMKGWDATGEKGPKKPLPDMVQITEPGIDKVFAEPTSEQRGPGAETAQAAAPPPAEEQYAPPETFAAEPAYQEQGEVEQSGF
jgi:small subunit ribosomal protein S3e